MARIDTPSGPNELTAKWLTEALSTGGILTRSRVTEARIEPAGVGRAFAGAPVRVSLTYDHQEAYAPSSLVAKFAASEPRMRAALSGLGWYETEIRFYQELANDSDIRTPRHYFSAMEPEQQSYVLLIEDVIWGNVGDQIEGGTIDTVESVIDHIGAFHRQWWQDPRIDKLKWLADGEVRRLENATGWQEFYVKAWAKLGELMPEIADGAVSSVAEELGQSYAMILRAAADSPRTLIHGDCRLDNILFTKTTDTTTARPIRAPTFIDWQLLSYGRGVYDIAYFLGTNITPELRRSHEIELLRRYHSIISPPVGNPASQHTLGEYDFDTCLRDYRLAMLLVFGFWVQSAGAATFPVAAYPLRNAALERVTMAILELDAETLLGDLERV